MFGNIQEFINIIHEMTNEDFEEHVKVVGVSTALNFLEVSASQLYLWCKGIEPIPMPYKYAMLALVGVTVVGSNSDNDAMFMDSVNDVAARICDNLQD